MSISKGCYQSTVIYDLSNSVIVSDRQ